MIKKHEFFRGINWEKLAYRDVKAPFQPDVLNPKDLRYFDKV